MLATQAAFGIHINAALQTELAVIAATQCVAPLLLLLLTPRAAPTTRASGKASTTPDEQPAPPVAALTDAQPGAGTLAPAPANDTAMAHAAVPVVPPTSDGAQPKYRSRMLSRSVAFTAKFPSPHLADHPAAATPAWRDTLSVRFAIMLSEQASLQRGVPVSLRVMQMGLGAGCVVVHGRVFENNSGVSVSGDKVAAMLRAMGTSDVLMRLLPQGACLLDGDTAVLQLDDGAPPMELAYSAADGCFVEAPARSAPPPVPPPGVPLLSATWPLLALPASGSGRVHLQFGTALLAHALGHEPELVVSWVPSGASAAPTPLVRERVAALQAAARSRGNPPGLIDIDVDLGPRPSHGMFIAQLVDGDTLLAAHAVALLPASAAVVVAELLRARLPLDTLHAVAHDLGVLLCGPRVRAPGDAAELRSDVVALMEWERACNPGLPALRALLDGLLRKLDAGGAEEMASPRSSSPVTPATDVATPRLPRANRPLLLWVWTCLIIASVMTVQFVVEGSGVAALAMAFHGMPYVLTALPPTSRLLQYLPRALRGVDSCVARRVYGTIVAVLTMASRASFSSRAVYCNYGGDIPLLLAWAWFERPRSPVLGGAISLLVELPTFCLLRWYECGQPASVRQMLCEVGLREAVLTALHVTIWYKCGRRDGAGASSSGKLKVA
ncbi:hypothetical protein FOA52_016122 [Chlamydomonas sp. UWO 241]|nr:hypothetical protein FOA52_016122 [Chlamydomonas sp. UWO 241]